MAKSTWAKNEATGSASKYGGILHYSFDYAQNVHYPSNPQQPGPAYFKSLCCCGIFGVTCEPLGIQVNHLVDENDDNGKGANATISLLDHFLHEHGVQERDLSLHAENCQNKNYIFMQYLLWRVMTGKNRAIIISFMLVGHTKFAADRFFGLIKRKFRHTPVFSLKDMVQVVKSSMVGGCNVPQLTKGLDGQRLIIRRDWKSFLADNFQHISRITSYHHFRFDAEYPGFVFLKEFANSMEGKVKMANTETHFSSNLPEEIQLAGMDIKRRWYLYEEVRPLCMSSESVNLTCPCPSQPKPGSNMVPDTSGSRKRKRTCSQCHEEQHTKTKKGKISCPQLLNK